MTKKKGTSRKVTGQRSYYQEVHLDLSDETLAALRPGQIGAIHSLRSYAVSRGDAAALLSLPTGYGKSELIALAPALFRARRTLVVAPSRIVRSMLAQRVSGQKHLRSVGIILDSASKPAVHEQDSKISTKRHWASLEEFDVVVAHPQSVSPSSGEMRPPSDLFDLLVFDEAHHLPAQSWSALLRAFPEADVVGFSATPFRRDRQPLPGRVIFSYPLHRAVKDQLFAPITYQLVSSGPSKEERDNAVASAAIQEHQRREAERPSVARLLVRSDTVKRAQELAALYSAIDTSVRLEVITSQTTKKDLDAAIARLESGESDGVSFVGVLGEGFDLPSLKIAAYHNPHRSLPVTIQFAGRIARVDDAEPDEPALLLASDAAHPEIVAELHRDNQRWDLVMPGLAANWDRQPTRMWSALDADATEVVGAFTYENFRCYGLAQVFIVKDEPKALDLESLLDPETTFSIDEVQDRDVARVIAAIDRPEIFTTALLFERRHPVSWLRDTPENYAQFEHLVLTRTPSKDGGSWVCVRSTLPDQLTRVVLDAVIGNRDRPQGHQLARFETDLFATGNYTALGQRSTHPVAAGVKSYETGSGRSVERSVSRDDQFLTAVGHAIVVDPGRQQAGIAFESGKVWSHGYLDLDGYHSLGTTIAAALDASQPTKTLGGLRIPGGDLSQTAKPIAAELDVSLDPDLTTILTSATGQCSVRELVLSATRKAAGPISVEIKQPGKSLKLTTIEIDPSGHVLSADGLLIADGVETPLTDALAAHPIAVYFNDGSFLRGHGGHIEPPAQVADYFPIAANPLALDARPYSNLTETNRLLTIGADVAKLTEKGTTGDARILALAADTGAKVTTSLLQFMAKQGLAENADVIFCDDSTGEKADIIMAWRSYGHTGAPHLRLIHCKSKGQSSGAPAKPGARLKSAEEVAQQTLRSVSFCLGTPDGIADHLAHRTIKHPSREIHGSTTDLRSILAADPIALTTEIWVLHPGLSAQALSRSDSVNVRTLLGSLRARLRSTRIDFAVVTSA